MQLSAEPTAYGDYLAERWREGETFVNVEHDIIAWPGAIDGLLGCSRPWCHYDYRDDFGPSWERPYRPAVFGCVKFGAELIAATPEAWADRRAAGADGFEWADGGWLGRGGDEWTTLDSFFWMYAAARGLEPHLHRPAVHNAHP